MLPGKEQACVVLEAAVGMRLTPPDSQVRIISVYLSPLPTPFNQYNLASVKEPWKLQVTSTPLRPSLCC